MYKDISHVDLNVDQEYITGYRADFLATLISTSQPLRFRRGDRLASHRLVEHSKGVQPVRQVSDGVSRNQVASSGSNEVRSN